MLFSKYNYNYNLSNYRFINIENVAIGCLAVTRIDNKDVPYASSSSDKIINVCLKKLYSEYLERSNMGFNYNSQYDCSAFDLINHRITLIKRKYLSYGKNKMYGYVDTTGTASGNSCSYTIIEKSISELIEKNELYLFWYCNMGKKIPEKKYQNMEISLGMDQYDNYMFLSQNLSSWSTVICITFKDGIVQSTGICCDKLLSRAIFGALRESKILKVLNSYRFNTMYNFGEDINHEIFTKIVNYEDFDRDDRDFGINIKEHEINLCNWINSIFISNLNTGNRALGKTISAHSPALLKCLPTKQNLMHCQNIPIVKKYKNKVVETMLDCFIS